MTKSLKLRPNLKATMTMRSINKMLDERDLGLKSDAEMVAQLKAFLDNKGLRFPVIEKP